jgi:hypothetical protein
MVVSPAKQWVRKISRQVRMTVRELLINGFSV